MLTRTLFVVATAGFLAGTNAQTQDQLIDCASTIDLQTASLSSFETGDTSYYNQTYTYDPTLCYISVDIPVDAISITDENTGTTFTCDLEAFDDSGSLVSVCPVTKGELATRAQAGDGYFLNDVKLGTRPLFYTVETEINIVGETTVSPSAAARRRRRQLLEQSPETWPRPACAAGFSSCWTGVRDQFECIQTSSDVTACGGCPHSADARDCTNISGANEVQCVHSHCSVISCDPFHTLNKNGTCIPNGRRRRPSLL